MPLIIINQPKMRVMATPETKGTRRAKRPARMSRTLSAMDQLIDLGARAERVDGAVLIGCPPEVVDTGADRWAENNIVERLTFVMTWIIWKMTDHGMMTMVEVRREDDGCGKV